MSPSISSTTPDLSRLFVDGDSSNSETPELIVDCSSSISSSSRLVDRSDCLVSTVAVDEIQSTIHFLLSPLDSDESNVTFGSKAMFDPGTSDSTAYVTDDSRSVE
jgi:hypothetical protein